MNMNMCQTNLCKKEDGLEDCEHLFTSCSRTQIAWAWIKRKVQNILPGWAGQYPSNFELLHLAYEALLDTEVLWLVSNFCFYVWEERRVRDRSYVINVDKLRSHLVNLYVENQTSQNPLEFIPL